MAEASRAVPMTGGYRSYVLGLLVVVYVSNFIDRTIVNIVAQPMKEDLGLSDTQIGLLGGLAFALFYSVLGLPIARLAERYSRVTIIAAALAVWSGMTAVCGLAQSFAQLLLARVGVGVGEAGCSPAAQSLIADYYPPERRATALAVYSLGIPLGSLMGAVAGGWIAQEYGWRAAFMLLGLPGLLLALVVKLTIKEPLRGGLDRRPVAATPTPGFGQVVRTLMAKPAFIHVALGGAMASFAGYGVGAFVIPFLLRGFDISLAQASSVYGLIGGLSAAVGTAMGGWLADRYGAKRRRNHVLIPAIGLIVSVPLYVLCILQQSLAAMALLIIVPAVTHYFYLGPTWGLTSNMVEPRMRATATAILLLIINLIGLGLGPVVVGALSDLFAAQAYAGDFAAACPGGRAPEGAPAGAGEACRTASFRGVRFALLAGVAVYGWAGIHYLLAGRTLERDLETGLDTSAPAGSQGRG